MRFLAVLVALVGAAQADSCNMECQTRASKSIEAICSPWREELPRPALYVACKDAFETGYHIACEQLCLDEPNMSAIISKKFDTCDPWKSTGQQQYTRGCLSGYGGGYNAAKEVIEDSKKAAADAPPSRSSPKSSDSSGSGASVKKINVKLSDKARDEAANAFSTHGDL